jgi:hypothetical protein
VGETGRFSCEELGLCSLYYPCCAVMVAPCVVLPWGYLLAVAPRALRLYVVNTAHYVAFTFVVY